MLHGDLKPANILVRSDDSPVLIDFLIIDVQRLLDPRVVPPHLCSDFEADCITAAFGTPGFMAPEQEREGVVTVRTDIYGLGRTLQYLFEPSNEWSRRKMLDNQADHDTFRLISPLLRSMLSHKPSERPNSMKEVLSKLRIIAKELHIKLPKN